MNRAVLLFSVLIALAAMACDDTMPSGGNDPTPTSIIASTWRLESIERNGQTERIDAAMAILLRFDSTTFAGNGPCNRYSGSYAIDGAAMTITALESGDSPCDQADLQARYLDGLRGVTGHAATATTLKLYAAGGSTVLTYGRSSATIDTTPKNVDPAGRTWRLVKIEAGGVIDTLVEAPWVTLTLGTRASGKGPCSQYSAFYTIDSIAIDFEDLESSNESCPRAEREARYFTALDNAHSYYSTEKTLRIRHDGGTLHYIPHVPDDTVRNGPIAGREWRLRKIADGQDTIEIGMSAGVSIAFGLQGEFSGLGPCSRYLGTYSSDGRKLSIGSLSDGGITCSARPLEERYLRLLKNAARYEATEAELWIITAEGATLYYERGRQMGNPLVGTSWRLEHIAARGGVEAVPNGMVKLSFRDRDFEGISLCNTYEGAYTLAPGGRITIPEFSSTERACLERFEERYFAVLPNVVEYRHGPDRLILFAPTATLYYRPF